MISMKDHFGKVRLDLEQGEVIDIQVALTSEAMYYKRLLANDSLCPEGKQAIRDHLRSLTTLAVKVGYALTETQEKLRIVGGTDAG